MKNIIAFCIAAAIFSLSLPAMAGSSSKKDIALQLYSLRGDIKKDYDSTIKKVGEMGYTSIEAAGYKDGKFYGRTPEEFKKDIEENGMKVLSSHTHRLLSAAELKSGTFSDETMRWWDQCIAAHKAAGMKYLAFPWMKKPENLRDLKTYCNYLNEIGRRCKEAGIEFCYHNHSFEFDKIENKLMYDFMLENTDPKYVGFEMDVYWVVMGKQSPVEYFEKYPGRFKLLHIKDRKELGESGMVGFDAIFKHIGKAGAKYIVVEVERYSFEPEVSVKKSIEYLQNAPFVKPSYSE